MSGNKTDGGCVHEVNVELDHERFSQTIPCIFVTGDYYDVGFQIGKTFKQRITDYVAQAPTVDGFLHRSYLREAFDEYVSVAHAQFPHYMKEARGIADGCGVDFKLILCHILRAELRLLEDCHVDSGHVDSGHVHSGHVHSGHVDSGHVETIHDCTTITLNYPGQRAIVHNEDLYASVKECSYMVRAHVVSQGANGSTRQEHFWAHSHPGNMCGTAFGCNAYGLVICCNGIYPNYVPRARTPRYFLNRAMLSAKSPEQLFRIMENEGYGVAHAFSANVGYMPPGGGSPRMWNVEVGPSKEEKRSVLDVLEIVPGHSESTPPKGTYYHFNEYESGRGREHEQSFQSSSHFRREAAGRYPVARCVREALVVLGDTSNAQYPMFRSYRPSDASCTVATAVFDLEARTMAVYRGNPGHATNPVFNIGIDKW